MELSLYVQAGYELYTKQTASRICADRILVTQNLRLKIWTAIKSKDIHSTSRVHCVYIPHQRYAESLKVLHQVGTDLSAPIPRKYYTSRHANLIPQTSSSPASRL